MNVWIHGLIFKFINKWIKKNKKWTKIKVRMSERIFEWRMIELINDWTNELIASIESASEWMIEWMNEWIKIKIKSYSYKLRWMYAWKCTQCLVQAPRYIIGSLVLFM